MLLQQRGGWEFDNNRREIDAEGCSEYPNPDSSRVKDRQELGSHTGGRAGNGLECLC